MNNKWVTNQLASPVVLSGSTTWKSPSNIALVKYWGKHGLQLPRNPSISFTLDQAHTITSVAWEVKSHFDAKIDLEFLFEGKQNLAFGNKIKKFLEKHIDIFPFISQLKLKINSGNSFPHSSGIASSASSMSALSACICDIERSLFDTKEDEASFLQKISNIARLASGSASRSVYPKIGMWGKTASIPESNDTYAIPYAEGMHPVFDYFHDDILIVSGMEKAVSSSAGHALMEQHPFAQERYLQAHQNIEEIVHAMRKGDLTKFGKIVEQEALVLHGLMMCSNPNFILLEPNTLAVINRLRQFRKETGLQVYFTLDAGPNVHILYPNEIANVVQTFIHNDLKQYCVDGKIIQDKVGQGTQKLS